MQIDERELDLEENATCRSRKNWCVGMMKTADLEGNGKRISTWCASIMKMSWSWRETRIVFRAGAGAPASRRTRIGGERELCLEQVPVRQHEFEEGKFELASWNRCAGMIDENVLGLGTCVSCCKRCSRMMKNDGSKRRTRELYLVPDLVR